MKQILIIVSLIQQLLSRPVFVIHGFGETCADIEKTMEPIGTGYRCLKINEGIRSTSQIVKQATSVCDWLRKIKDIKKGFDIIAFGQGGLIARSVLAECAIGPHMKRLVTIGTPNLGLSEYPSSHAFNSFDKQKIFDKLKNMNGPKAPSSILYAPAAYRYTSMDENGKSSSNFLNRVNLGGPITLVRYHNLELMINFGINSDPRIIPEESATFGVTFKNGRITRFFPETGIYERNQLNMRDMYEENRLINCSITDQARLKYALLMAQNMLMASLKTTRQNGQLSEAAVKHNGKIIKMLAIGAPNKIKCEGKMIQYSKARAII